MGVDSGGRGGGLEVHTAHDILFRGLRYVHSLQAQLLLDASETSRISLLLLLQLLLLLLTLLLTPPRVDDGGGSGDLVWLSSSSRSELHILHDKNC